MNDYITKMRESIRELKSVADSFGRPGARSRELDCALLTLLTDSLRRGRPRRSLWQVLEQVRLLPDFNSLSDKELDNVILNILLFVYDKELLEHTRDSLSRTWPDVDDEYRLAINSNRIGVPVPRQDESGLSLVLRFRYPEEFVAKLGEYLGPIARCVQRTAEPHFTIFNIATKISNKDVKPIIDSVIHELENELYSDFLLLHVLDELLRFRIAHHLRTNDRGDLVLFGSGRFLERMHEFRVRLRAKVSSLDPETFRTRAPQPVWVHSVYARVVRKSPEDPGLTASAVHQMQTGELAEEFCALGERMRRSVVTDVKLSLIRFLDTKAMLSPEIFDLRFDRVQFQPVIT
jgi:hypothetical protein